MNEKPLLSICIPTYNRDYLLDKTLQLLCPIAKRFSIPIFISDNGSVDDTQLVIKKYSADYDVIGFKQEQNLGSDKNFEFLLTHAIGKYRWLLGDSTIIDENELSQLIDKLVHNDYSFVVTGTLRRTDLLLSENVYTDQNALLKELGWHMTYVSVLIYNEKVVSKCNYQRYYNSYYLQTGVIFEYIAQSEDWSLCFFNNLKSSTFSIEKKGHWDADVIPIFCKKWYLFVMSLPLSYNYEAKNICIRAHADKTKLFRFKSCLYLRLKGGLSFSKIFRYYNFIRLTTSDVAFMLLVCFFPRFMLKPLDAVRCYIKQMAKK